MKVLFNVNLCLLLCRDRNCLRRDYDHCIMGYISMSLFDFKQTEYKSFPINTREYDIISRITKRSAPSYSAGFCNFIEDEYLRRVCTEMESAFISFYSEKIEDVSDRTFMQSIFLGDIDIRHDLDIDMAYSRWQNETAPMLLSTPCSNAFQRLSNVFA